MRFFAALMVVAAFVSTPASAQHDDWITSWAAGATSVTILSTGCGLYTAYDAPLVTRP